MVWTLDSFEGFRWIVSLQDDSALGSFSEESVISAYESLSAFSQSDIPSPLNKSNIEMVSSPSISVDETLGKSFSGESVDEGFAAPLGIAPRKLKTRSSPKSSWSSSGLGSSCSLGEEEEDGFNLEDIATLSPAGPSPARQSAHMSSLLTATINIHSTVADSSTNTQSVSPRSSNANQRSKVSSIRRCLSVGFDAAAAGSSTPCRSSAIQRSTSLRSPQKRAILSQENRGPLSPGRRARSAVPLAEMSPNIRPHSVNIFKRTEPPFTLSDDLCQPTVKRHRPAGLARAHSCFETSGTIEEEENVSSPTTLSRWYSEATIKLAVQRSSEEPHLIGDFSTSFALPLIAGKHNDLKMISPNTLSAVLRGDYSETIGECLVIDCRYPYEYEGGHIKSALNLYTQTDLEQALLPGGKPRPLEFVPSSFDQCSSNDTRRRILVFHCEFSSERGPRLSRFLRNTDRELNKETYPSLFYPEVYVLEGGYEAFFKSYPELCDPVDYKPMRHKDHENELRLFRAKSKSSSALGGKGRIGAQKAHRKLHN